MTATNPSEPARHAARSSAPGALIAGGKPVALQIAAVSDVTLRVTLAPIAADGSIEPVAEGPELALATRPRPIAELRALPEAADIDWNRRQLRVSANPLRVVLQDETGREALCLTVGDDGTVEIDLGSGPLFGLGQGGKQFDRRGGSFPLVNGQGEGEHALDMRLPGAQAPIYAFDLAHEGARITIPWIVGAQGSAVFVHRPLGRFEASDGKLLLAADAKLPVDAFLTLTPDPVRIMRELATLTGYPHLPPLWSLGYMQSRRTLESRAAILEEAKEFRRRGLPCDAFIYLGTGFTTGGWNTGHGQFRFNETLFPDAPDMLRQLHDDHLRVAVHVVDPPLHLHGKIADTGPERDEPDHVASYWRRHRPVVEAGMDGWWPDVGDKLDIDARLARIRMYWDGCLKDDPAKRPFALHRNGYAGMQRWGWLWSGDIDSTWQTLAMQVPVGINCGLTGIPYWGTDIGGFITTPELTGELFVRWFQFGAFCPLFRAHGRTWKLRLPWGWNTGEYGPEEYDGRRLVPGTLPDPRELRNPAVEPICKSYLELRYRLLPYLYAAVRETHETGLPIMRALWLHHPDDAQAVLRGDEYLWGRDMLVAPVVEKAATSRTLYLPDGTWHDFWTGDVLAGRREITRPVDLETIPLYVRAGAIIPNGPVKQYTDEAVDAPLTLSVYPGADGATTIYEDDGISLAHASGDFRKIAARWDDRARTLTLRLAPDSKPLPAARTLQVRRGAAGPPTTVVFDGKEQSIRL